MEEPGSSVSLQSSEERIEEAGSSAVCQSHRSDMAKTQTTGLVSDSILQLRVILGKNESILHLNELKS